MKPFFRLSLAAATLLSLGVAFGCASTTVSSDTTPTTAASESSASEPAPSDASASEVADSSVAETYAVFAEDGVAIRGADPVAYFTEEAYVPGSDEFTYDWQGATWQFASAENRDKFASDPEQYAPQYGGFCAWAVSQGYTASVDPTAWKVVEGKLYLNYDARIQNRWANDIPGNIAKANANWPAVLTN